MHCLDGVETGRLLDEKMVSKKNLNAKNIINIKNNKGKDMS